MVEQAKGALIHNGLSQDLLDMLQAIEESEARYQEGEGSLSSQRMYSRDSVYELRMSILCRNYGKNALWEYANYVTALQHYFPEGVFQLFWLDDCTTAAGLKNRINELGSAVLDMAEKNKLRIQFDGGRSFTLHLHRVNWVAAWTAFLACVDPAFVAKLAQQKQLSAKAVNEFCAYLKQKVDVFIEPRMQTIHAQRQGWAFLSWLEDQEVDDGFSDDEVLQFWQEKAQDEDGDFKRYKTVVAVAMTLQEAIRIYDQRQAGKFAVSYNQNATGEDASWLMDEGIDSGIEGGIAGSCANEDWTEAEGDFWGDAEIDDGLFNELLEEKNELYCSRLARHPLSEIKFFTAKDSSFFEEFELHSLSSLRLPLSYLRGQVFGDHQSRLTEAQRKKNMQRVDDLLILADLESYDSFRAHIRALIGKTVQTIDAALYSLLCAGEPDAMAVFLMELGDEQTKRVRDALTRQSSRNIHQISAVSEISPEFSSGLLDVLEREAPNVLKRYETAFNKVNRAGFRALASEQEIPVYREGLECLNGLKAELARYQSLLENLWPNDALMKDCELGDQQIFQSVYRTLYTAQETARKGVEG